MLPGQTRARGSLCGEGGIGKNGERRGSSVLGGNCLNFYKQALLFKFKLHNAYIDTHIYVENIFLNI